MKKISGKPGPYETGRTITKSDKESTIVEVEGPYATLKGVNAASYCPNGMVVEDTQLSPTGGGYGKMSIRCVNYGSENVSTTPTRVTWKITMAETTTDLKHHPLFEHDDKLEIDKWLATDKKDRYDQGGNPQYVDEGGSAHALGENATKYAVAYDKGIESYIRYFPVVEKISYYKRLPGCSMSQNSITGGTASFSHEIGTWNVPSVKLSGYDNSGWFKSGDNYEQGNDLVWTRVEQWTWTPEGSGSDTKWIYEST